MDASDIVTAAHLLADAVAPAEEGWGRRAGALDWTCRRTLDHCVDVMFLYAVHLASRAEGPLPWPRRGDQAASIKELQGTLVAGANVLAAVVREAPPAARGFHPAGVSDPEGFAAMAVDELLVHGDDLTQALGYEFRPPPELCAGALARLFPWAPQEGDPWRTLLWANGRIPLDDRPQQGSEWVWWAAPVSEWDGVVPVWRG